MERYIHDEGRGGPGIKQKYSKAEFQNATEQIMERDKIIKSLHQSLRHLEEHHSESGMSGMMRLLQESEQKLKCSRCMK